MREFTLIYERTEVLGIYPGTLITRGYYERQHRMFLKYALIYRRRISFKFVKKVGG